MVANLFLCLCAVSDIQGVVRHQLERDLQQPLLSLLQRLVVLAVVLHFFLQRGHPCIALDGQVVVARLDIFHFVQKQVVTSPGGQLCGFHQQVVKLSSALLHLILQVLQNEIVKINVRLKCGKVTLYLSISFFISPSSALVSGFALRISSISPIQMMKRDLESMNSSHRLVADYNTQFEKCLFASIFSTNLEPRHDFVEVHAKLLPALL